ncbi:hypothetical protein TEA_012116 [Camellia sinensis var. sinensis]|uniref:Vps53 N-terminal domain-containing protein n=1 Tax=Camellia sinensis var. sinensis TaxID=542762 RepID=A0A4S4CW16_CAMSN|nr:hypothetical protein TEA_012116 [Camellia sinensis var. sinensis]
MDKLSALDYINQMFPTEASLSGVEPLMQKIHSEIRRVDAGILAAVRQQSNSGTKAKEDLAAATCAVEELMYKIREIKSKAEQSETMVQKICRDIKKLDFAKKHITTTITALHRLTMLEEKNIFTYPASGEGPSERCGIDLRGEEEDEELEDVDAVAIGDYVVALKEEDADRVDQRHQDEADPTVVDERRRLVQEFERIGSIGSNWGPVGQNPCTSLEVSAVEQLQLMASKRQYKEAAAQLEAVNQLCSHFEAYKDIPKVTELREKFKNIKQILKSHVFSDFSRTQIVEILNNLKEKPDVGTLLLALQRTLEFEEELAEKFGDSTHSRETGNDNEETGRGGNNSQTVSDIRKKYEKKLAAHQGSETEEKDRQKDLVPGAGFNFHGIISSCFEPHLTVYVELEERTLMENLEKLVQEETWDIDEGNQTNILSSSMQVFLIIRRSLKRCSALTKSQTLLNLFKVFQRILKAYATKLFARLPKGGTGIVAAATGMDGQIKTSDRDERVICYIINTAEYCHKTSGELAENVSSIINPQLADGVDMSEVQDEFSAVITKALVTLVHGLETKFDAEMVVMTRIPWGTLESVGDQSEYINSINMILTSSIPVLGSLLSPIYFQFFLDKLASSLGPRFYANIFKCKHISETGAQQMLLDTQAIKTILLDIPSLGRQTSGAASYSKFVSREMSKAEALLKVILSPVDSVADTYRALLPEGTTLEFQRILELKGMKKADQQSILDDFNKHGSGINQPPHMVAQSVVVPSVPTAPMASTMSTPGSVGVIASREDVLTRAAALGRGAATTGFKRFLALTEAAKDRKDGPFRKLFNT